MDALYPHPSILLTLRPTLPSRVALAPGLRTPEQVRLAPTAARQLVRSDRDLAAQCKEQGGKLSVAPWPRAHQLQVEVFTLEPD